jgi:hypothetical protein
MKKLFVPIFSFFAGLALLISPAYAASMNVVVNSMNMHGWAFTTDDKDAGTANMVMGQSTPPRGMGSAHFALTSQNQSEALALYGEYLGLPLSQINALEYSTYQTTSNPQVVSLQMNIDYDGAGGNEGYQGRLVYEPYLNGTPAATIWQSWDAKDEGNAQWWMSRAPNTGEANPCPQSTPCTWNQVLQHYPNARLNNTYAGILLKSGSGWSSFDGNVDMLRVAIQNGSDITYDFEPLVPPPTNKEQCKNGGWMTFNNPTFRNQGQCVSFTNH